MKIQLSEHFTYGKLLRFSVPSIVMMIFSSVYGIVDGLFVSNVVGKLQFAAINIIFPVFMIIGAFGFMMGAGGTAIVSKTLGEGQRERANEYFSLIVYVTAALGITTSLLGVVFLRPLASLLGAEGETLGYCVSYGRILLPAMPFFMLQNLFQSFFIAAEKPKLGLFVTVLAGVTNIVLDALFIAVFDWGLVGAALATATSQAVGGISPIFYFGRKNTSLLKLTKTKFYRHALFMSMLNGSSEFLSNISASIVTVFYNLQLMKFAKEDGVAAYGVIMYISFIFIAVFIGYSISTAPIVGFHYGAKNTTEIKSLLRKSVIINLIGGTSMVIISFVFAVPLSKIFVSYDSALLEMTARGLRIFSLSFVLSGICIFSSSFFTALSNGPVSAAISVSRTLIFQSLLVLLLPILFGLDGIWFSMLASELLSLLTAVVFLIINRRKYGYM